MSDKGELVASIKSTLFGIYFLKRLKMTSYTSCRGLCPILSSKIDLILNLKIANENLKINGTKKADFGYDKGLLFFGCILCLI